jgi:hypothetical protein
MAHGILTAQRLRELLHYDPATGIFTWRIGRRSALKAGCFRSDGYLYITVDGRQRLSHRLAWLWMTSDWPSGTIDHIDGNPSNNRFENLRDVTIAENIQNRRKARVDSKTGVLGVSFDKRRNKFRAAIKFEGRRLYLGQFVTAESAHAAYVEAKRRLHPGNML